MGLRPRQQRGTHSQEPALYGRSYLGAPLEVWKPSERCAVIVFAGIHGDEPESTRVLSHALRCLAAAPPRCAVVLAANPDGLARGTRANARGVDLNRNFPASNWRPDPVVHRATLDEPRDVELSPGAVPASEPETTALLALLAELRPATAIALHAPLACVEDPDETPLGRWLSEATCLPLVDDVGYATPGSFGSWAAENGVHEITWELPVAAGEDLVRAHAPVLVELLGRADL